MSYVTEIGIDTKKPITDTRKKDAKEKLNKEYEEDSRLVTGIFKNLEAPGGTLEFAYRKYPQDPTRLYKFEDGKEYEVPICVAKHINTDCVIQHHKYLINLDGDRIVEKDKKNSVQRYQFLSKDYM